MPEAEDSLGAKIGIDLAAELQDERPGLAHRGVAGGSGVLVRGEPDRFRADAFHGLLEAAFALVGALGPDRVSEEDEARLLLLLFRQPRVEVPRGQAAALVVVRGDVLHEVLGFGEPGIDHNDRHSRLGRALHAGRHRAAVLRSEDDALRARGQAAIYNPDLLDGVALPQRAIEDDSNANTLFSQQVIRAAFRAPPDRLPVLVGQAFWDDDDGDFIRRDAAAECERAECEHSVAKDAFHEEFPRRVTAERKRPWGRGQVARTAKPIRFGMEPLPVQRCRPTSR